ncbi:MAG TPA: FAD-dependent oxidoreductase [Thermoanaerobaculia bacterium]
MHSAGEQGRLDLERLLAASSRTFALAIPLLPEPTQREVTIAYLLFRIADTFEDATAWPPARRIEALERFARLLRRPDRAEIQAAARRWAEEVPCEQPGYRELLAETPFVFDELFSLSPAAVGLVRTHTLRTARGMAGFVRRSRRDGEVRLESLADLRRYCYAVAGVVGELLTELFLLNRPGLAPVAAALRARCRSFGEALQLVNILRDSASDAAQGRRYLPQGVDRAGVMALARADLRTAAEYVLILQSAGAERGLVAFTALPLQLADATLDRVEIAGPGAKLSRPEVYAILQRLERALDRNEPAVIVPAVRGQPGGTLSRSFGWSEEGSAMNRADIVVVGAGLAGLSCGFELSSRGRGVLLLEAGPVVGGRTSSWNKDGMMVESGLHRVLGFYDAFPELLRQAGIDVNQIVYWEDEVEIRLPDGRGSGVFGAAPVFRPFETVGGALGNFELLSLQDRLTLAGFLSAGLLEYYTDPAGLDQVSVRKKAEAYGVTENAIHNVLIPLTSGLYFLPPERYSAYAFFGTLGPYLPRILTLRVGAFLGGMTDVMAAPIASAIVRNGGEVRTRARVTRLLTDGGRVSGVEVAGERIAADHVVLATSLAPAQRLIRQALGGHPWFRAMLRLPSMPSVTIQIELDRPSMPIDRTTFGPGTVLASFAEQSRTTFRRSPGRLSVILTPPEPFLGMDPAEILEITCRDAERLGVRVRDRIVSYRVVKLPEDFYSLSPGNDALRPAQATPIPGLTLAGDYTRQEYLATMEGAVVSGRLAARAVEEARWRSALPAVCDLGSSRVA